MADKRYKAEDIIKFIRDVLVKLDYSEKESEAASRILVEADLRDVREYGLFGRKGIEYIFEKTKKGEISKDDPEIMYQKYPLLLDIDAKNGLGYSAVEIACDWVIETALKLGTARAEIINSHYFGIPNYHSEKIAEKNMTGKVFVEGIIDIPIALSYPIGNGEIFTFREPDLSLLEKSNSLKIEATVLDIHKDANIEEVMQSCRELAESYKKRYGLKNLYNEEKKLIRDNLAKGFLFPKDISGIIN